jgi:hypothetical protein
VAVAVAPVGNMSSVTNATLVPFVLTVGAPLLTVSNAPAVVGKSVEQVCPVT